MSLSGGPKADLHSADNKGPRTGGPQVSRPLQGALAVAALLTVFTAWWVDDDNPAPAESAQAPTPRRAEPLRASAETRPASAWPASPVVRVDALPAPSSAALAAWGGSLLGDTPGSRAAAAAARPASALPSAPEPAPAPPAYTLIGLLTEAGHADRALLQAGTRTLVVASGDTLDGRWAVEGIADRSVTLRALQGDTRHTLRFKPA